MGDRYWKLYNFVNDGELDKPIIDFVCKGGCKADDCEGCVGSDIALEIADQISVIGLKAMQLATKEWIGAFRKEPVNEAKKRNSH